MFYIYNNFVLDGVITQYNSVKWVRSYNNVGDFEIEMPLDKHLFSIINTNTVIYNKEVKEACFVLNKRVLNDNEGNEIFYITGKSMSHILSSRITTYIGTATISSIVTSLLNNNFIKATNHKRNIPNFAIETVNIINNPSISIKYENVDVLTIITEITQQYNIGFKITYDVKNKQFLFKLYEGAEKNTVVFSYDYNNVLEQEYFLDAENYKNTCLVDDNGTVTIVNNDNAGLNRYETYTNLSTDSTATATEQGKLFLQQYKINESMETVIDNNTPQFVYLTDWNLGDIITTVNKKLDVKVQKNVLTIEEFYDTTDKSITVTFGDYL